MSPLRPEIQKWVGEWADGHFRAHYRDILVRTDRMFAILMAIQWLGAIVLAAIVSPRAWAGSIPSVHVHVWSAVITGGLLSSLPIYLALRHPGRATTRHVIAVSQALWSALLIHLSGGRIEAHFHVFGSLAILASYRDWRVLISATVVVAVDHAIRGIVWPQSVYGVLGASPWRSVEHALWVLFEVGFLIGACRKGVSEMRSISGQRANLEALNQSFEMELDERTGELEEQLLLAKLQADVGLALTQGESNRQMLQACAEALVRHLRAAFARVWTLSGDGSVLELQASAGMYTHIDGDHAQVPVGKFKIGRIAEERQPHLTNDVLNDERVGDPEWARREGMVAFAGHPLLVGDRLVGVMALFARSPLSDQVLQALASIADSVALGVRRRDLERVLHDEHLLLNSVISNVPHCVFWKDRDLVYRGCNTAFARAAGIAKPPDISGRTDFDLPWAQSEAESARARDQKVMESREPLLDFEEQRRLADGTTATVLTSKVPLRDAHGLVTGVLGIFADSTCLKQAQRELRLKSVALDAAANVILITDRDGVIVWANRAALSSTGYEPTELIGNKPSVLKSGRNPDSLYRDLWTTIMAGQVWQGELINRHKDGSEYTAQMTIAPVQDDDQTITHFVAVQHDISEELHLKAQLSQAQKLESIGQLAAGIAHEINTPTQFIGDNVRFLESSFNDLLAALGKYAELLGREGGELPWAERRAAIEALEKEFDVEFLREEIPGSVAQTLEGVERVSTIVRSMKEFSHPAGDKKTQVDINRLIESTITVARNEWKYVAELETDLDSSLPLVSCRPGEINQVILNMIVNAAHAIAAAHAKDGRAGKIRVSSGQVEQWLEIRISDNGSGISEEHRARVFDPFFTTKEVGRGTGQGLAIAHNVVVEKHGGSIQVESEVGSGTTFIVRLPLEEVAAGVA